MKNNIPIYLGALLGLVLLVWLVESTEDVKKKKVLNVTWAELVQISYSLKNKKQSLSEKKNDKKKSNQNNKASKKKKQKKKSESEKLKKTEDILENYSIIVQSKTVGGKTITELKKITAATFGKYLKKQKKKYKREAVFIKAGGKKKLGSTKLRATVQSLLDWKLRSEETIAISKVLENKSRFKDRDSLFEHFGLLDFSEQIEIKLNNNKGPLLLNIGKANIAKKGNYVYIKAPSQKEFKYYDIIFSIPTHILKKFRTKLHQMAERRLISIPTDFITRIEVFLNNAFINKEYWYPSPKKAKSNKKKKIKKKKGKNSVPNAKKLEQQKKREQEFIKKSKTYKKLIAELPKKIEFVFEKKQKVKTLKNGKEKVSVKWEFIKKTKSSSAS